MTQSLLENIESIPPLPESVQEVENIYRDVDSTFEDMQKAIEKDPFLTANILRIANSPLYGVKTTVTSLQNAIALLGKDAIRTFVLSSVIDANFEIDLSPYNISQEEFRVACERQMALTIFWLKSAPKETLSIVAPAAFLVDIGRLVIAQTLINEGRGDIIVKSLESGIEISEAERDACGVQATDVTATLFHNWKLDPDMIHLIRYSDDPEGSSEDERKIVAQLKAVRETVELNGDITDKSIEIAKETIEEFSLDLKAYELALEKIVMAQEN